MGIKQQISEESVEKLKDVEMPDWVDPMLATLVHNRFSKNEWIYERKLDGERAIAFKHKGKSRIMSRNNKNLNAHYPEIVNAIEKLDAKNFIIDGEIVTFKGNITSFQKLQPRIQTKDVKKAKNSSIEVFYYIFDMLYAGSYDLREIPLKQRKKLLKNYLTFEDPIRYLTHRNENGKKYYEEACEKGWEGIIAKDGTSEYKGNRSKKWLKFKCINEQEFVIGGFTEPKGERIGFGALLIGFYRNGKLEYAGKVGTGYDDETLRDLHNKLKKMETSTSPFVSEIKEKNIHFVKPNLVCQIKFTEWTNNGKLRHPSYEGLREDKKPKNVVREKPRVA